MLKFLFSLAREFRMPITKLVAAMPYEEIVGWVAFNSICEEDDAKDQAVSGHGDKAAAVRRLL